MIQHLGFGRLATLFVAIALFTTMFSGPVVASEPANIEVYSNAVDFDSASAAVVEPLVSSDFADDLKKTPVDLPVSPSAAAQIAEPGTLGLMALAGLMGGAMVMRHRLG